MGAHELIQALAGMTAFAAALVVGVCMVLCARSHFTKVWERVRSLTSLDRRTKEDDRPLPGHVVVSQPPRRD
jgi:hypothetical protein